MKLIHTICSSTRRLSILLSVAALSFTHLHATERDDAIENAARTSFVFRTFLIADVIKLESKEGVAKLTGTVSEESHKILARNLVAAIPGVSNVDDQLIIRDTPEKHSDAWIMLKVKASLAYHRTFKKADTKVAVSEGVVTLTGHAVNQAQKDRISEYANDIDGIKGVINEMMLDNVADQTPTTLAETSIETFDDASTTAQVKMILLTHRSTMHLQLSVSTQDGVVAVSGMAHNTAEIDLVSKLAAEAFGASRVVNTMTLDINISKK